MLFCKSLYIFSSNFILKLLFDLFGICVLLHLAFHFLLTHENIFFSNFPWLKLVHFLSPHFFAVYFVLQKFRVRRFSPAKDPNLLQLPPARTLKSRARRAVPVVNYPRSPERKPLSETIPAFKTDKKSFSVGEDRKPVSGSNDLIKGAFFEKT